MAPCACHRLVPGSSQARFRHGRFWKKYTLHRSDRIWLASARREREFGAAIVAIAANAAIGVGAWARKRVAQESCARELRKRVALELREDVERLGLVALQRLHADAAQIGADLLAWPALLDAQPHDLPLARAQPVNRGG
jgi:hypothetical protein